jgi:transposase
MGAYSLDLRKKIVESVKKGVPKSETARRFGVDRATVKRYCKQLDERGTLEPRKAPGKRPKLDEKATKLLAKDLQERPWATHSQRAEFLFAVSGLRVSEATVCRAVGRLRRSRKKIRRGSSRKRRVLEEPMAHGTRSHRSGAFGVLKDEMGTHTSLVLPSTPTHP